MFQRASLLLCPLPLLILFLTSEAWHIITSTDPLIDSDNESGGDEYVRDDYREF